jgi:hypothetical protein
MNKRRQKYTIEEVSQLFKKENCVLLAEKYKDNNTPMNYICSCGNYSKKRLRSFIKSPHCKKCGTKNAIETNKKNHNGQLHFQTEKFKKYREKLIKDNPEIETKRMSSIKKTNLKKYGNEYWVASEKGKKEIKNSVLEKYGVEHVHQLKSVREKANKTIQEKYKVPNLAYLSSPASKESQNLFWEIYKKLNEEQKEKTYFASLNHEFCMCMDKKYYKYDFVNTKLNKIIEYNGFNFHPANRPDNEIN